MLDFKKYFMREILKNTLCEEFSRGYRFLVRQFAQNPDAYPYGICA